MEGVVELDRLPLVRAARFLSADEVRAAAEAFVASSGSEAAVAAATRATALFFAAQRPNDEEALAVAKVLVDEHGICDPSHRDRMNQTCLFYAARDGNSRLCEYLVRRGCDANGRDSHLQTCLFYAAREGRTEALQTLMKLGADPNIPDLNGQTALFYAAREGKLGAVQILLTYGANPSLKDKQRRSALTFARQGGHVDVIKLLKTPLSKSSGGTVVSPSPVATPTGTTVPTPSASSGGEVGGTTTISASSTIDPAAGSQSASTAIFFSSLPTAELSSNSCSSGTTTVSDSTSVVIAAYPVNTSVVYGLTPSGSSCTSMISSSVSSSFAEASSASSCNNIISPHAPTYESNSNHIFAAISKRTHCVLKTPTTSMTSSEPSGLLRKKYKLQYRPSGVDCAAGVLWLDAPLAKVEQFERIFPKIAIWPKNVSSFDMNPNTPDPLKREWTTAALSLVQDLSRYEGGHVFEKLVDVKKNNCPDYYEIVKNPTSFSCIKGKLRKFAYELVEDFIADVNLVFSNCRLYNNPNSWVSLVGAQLEKYFNNQILVRNFESYIRKQKEIQDELLQTAMENEQYAKQSQQEKFDKLQNDSINYPDSVENNDDCKADKEYESKNKDDHHDESEALNQDDEKATKLHNENQELPSVNGELNNMDQLKSDNRKAENLN